MKAVKYLTIEGRFEMKRGHLMSPTVAYETWGTLTPAADNAILIFTGLSLRSCCIVGKDPRPAGGRT